MSDRFYQAMKNAMENPDISMGDDKPISPNPIVSNAEIMTGAEKSFAKMFLEPLIESGEMVFWAFEPQEIRMVGQTYTPDFFALWQDGLCAFYEVKGEYNLGSQSRSSVKFRWASSFLSNGTIKFFWCKKKEGKWKIREVITKRKKHNQL